LSKKRNFASEIIIIVSITARCFDEITHLQALQRGIQGLGLDPRVLGTVSLPNMEERLNSHYDNSPSRRIERYYEIFSGNVEAGDKDVNK
jgi:hypothetical protein